MYNCVEVDCLITDSILSLVYDQYVQCINFGNSVSQEVEELCIVVIVSQKALPVLCHFTIVTLRRAPLSRFDLVSDFKLEAG
jgi:hypothetical protein